MRSTGSNISEILAVRPWKGSGKYREASGHLGWEPLCSLSSASLCPAWSQCTSVVPVTSRSAPAWTVCDDSVCNHPSTQEKSPQHLAYSPAHAKSATDTFWKNCRPLRMFIELYQVTLLLRREDKFHRWNRLALEIWSVSLACSDLLKVGKEYIQWLVKKQYNHYGYFTSFWSLKCIYDCVILK